jgi:hypothetical protein
MGQGFVRSLPDCLGYVFSRIKGGSGDQIFEKQTHEIAARVFRDTRVCTIGRKDW